ncbi:hypothetical protein PC129_g1054 [Phytophthora cactorum]|uniref:Uncharacterized protein n=1 Tax=Phytophthora cactorum TaxID=29920 RepID=A0A8T1LLQ7_9STRA|nr:hypothetical protein PC111_g3364 [Phytophthora cactorum]KAG3014178.1 hypothetical protein PC120_g12866 [Phytophthora cactorum]KAG3186120.1 hypothetical protein C6341_g4049 [Phytophthora cactorum]KAG3228380.1 hypothetical protein PC129_g1054 [Phytophthora cactorum]KAG4061764.1 hypothetical protein PC123_g3392 [Phytophthora cactorum]
MDSHSAGKCPSCWLNDLNDHSNVSLCVSMLVTQDSPEGARQAMTSLANPISYQFTLSGILHELLQVFQSGDAVASFFQVQLFSPRRSITQSVVIPSRLVSFALLVMVERLDDDVEDRRQSGEAAQEYRMVSTTYGLFFASIR